MANEISIYEPRTMGKVVSRLAPVRTFFRDTFFKNKKTFNTKSIDVDIKKGSRAIAQFIHPDAGSANVLNTGFTTETYTPPSIAEKKITTVDDILSRSPGEMLYNGANPAERAVLKMAEDFRELDERITRREELMAVQAIFLGKIPIVGKGVKYDITYSTKGVKTPAKKWNATGATPISDLEEWRTEVQQKGFVNCNICVMAADVVLAFIKSAEVKEALDVRNYEIGTIKPRELPNGVTYIGYIPKLDLTICQYNEWYLDNWSNPDTPVEKPLVPNGELALLSTNAQYSMCYAGVTTINEETKRFFTVEGIRVPRTWVTLDQCRQAIISSISFLIHRKLFIRTYNLMLKTSIRANFFKKSINNFLHVKQ